MSQITDTVTDMEIQTMTQCVECGRVFDLTDEVQANDYYGGHDCE